MTRGRRGAGRAGGEYGIVLGRVVLTFNAPIGFPIVILPTPKRGAAPVAGSADRPPFGLSSGAIRGYFRYATVAYRKWGGHS